MELSLGQKFLIAFTCCFIAITGIAYAYILYSNHLHYYVPTLGLVLTSNHTNNTNLTIDDTIHFTVTFKNDTTPIVGATIQLWLSAPYTLIGTATTNTTGQCAFDYTIAYPSDYDFYATYQSSP